MQTPGHFSAVVFRNRTWKPHFLSFVENVNGVVVVFKQYISAVVVRNPLIALPWRVRSLVLEENQWKLLLCFELATGGQLHNNTKSKVKLPILWKLEEN